MKSLQSRRLVVALIGSFVGFGGMVHAQTASTPLKTGLWVTTYAMKLNSVDSAVLLKSANAQMLKLLPANMQTNAKAIYDASSNRGATRNCVNATNAASVSTPSALFTNFAKMNPLCQLKATATTASSVSFTGTCNDPNSYKGNVSGQLNVVNPWVWNVDLGGTGTALPAAVTALGLPATTPVQMRTLITSRWSSASCSA